MRPNPLKAKLAAGKTVYGTMIFEFLAPGMPAALAAAGAEYLLYDMEHSGFDYPQMKEQFALARGLDVVPMVRPPAKTYSAVSRLLDLGAMGLLLQKSESAEEVREIISWTRYPPVGTRGAIFGGAHDDYAPGSLDEKMRIAHERTIVMPLIESVRGIEAVDEIAAVEGVDGLHLGQFDLTLSMGIPGQFDHPDFLRALDSILAACRRHGKFAACMAMDVPTIAAWNAKGFQLTSCSFDTALLQSALRNLINGAKAARA
jgi:2-keto-3-deoxy-L-rhamnonate aldolase RhmA